MSPTTLPLPERPRILWQLVPNKPRPLVCITQEDGIKLATYMEQLNEFEDAWRRLQK